MHLRIQLAVVVGCLSVNALAAAEVAATNPSNVFTSSSAFVTAGTQKDTNTFPERCAYLGRCGSFILQGTKGSAAYRMGPNRFVTDLEFAGQDANWWLYRPTAEGDSSTTMWALGKGWATNGGKAHILRRTNGRWLQYDLAEAWGKVGRTQAAGAVVDDQLILDSLRNIEAKLNRIQPGTAPSLNDLQKDILSNKQ